MKKHKRIYLLALCLLFASLGVIAAFAEGGHDTPVIPIHTRHTYRLYSTTEATCTEPGEEVYKCTGCTKTFTETIDPLGHQVNCVIGTNGDEVELGCKFCEDSIIVDKNELNEYWQTIYINQPPNRIAKSDSGYIDLDGNGIINAKDFAILITL